MKIIKFIKYIPALFIVFSFFWVMTRVSTPIYPQKIRGEYSICDVSNVNSWVTPQGYPVGLYSYLNPLTKDSYFKATYQYLLERSLLECKTKIPIDVLYNAYTINFLLESDQPVDIALSIKRFGQGPSWGKVGINKADVGKKLLITKTLNEANQPKLTWLSGDYDRVGLEISNLNPDKVTTITIYNIYLK